MKLKDLDNVYLSPTRVYHAGIGRFLQKDPVRDGHLYVYGANQPVHVVDPKGLQASRKARDVIFQATFGDGTWMIGKKTRFELLAWDAVPKAISKTEREILEIAEKLNWELKRHRHAPDLGKYAVFGPDIVKDENVGPVTYGKAPELSSPKGLFLKSQNVVWVAHGPEEGLTQEIRFAKDPWNLGMKKLESIGANVKQLLKDTFDAFKARNEEVKLRSLVLIACRGYQIAKHVADLLLAKRGIVVDLYGFDKTIEMTHRRHLKLKPGISEAKETEINRAFADIVTKYFKDTDQTRAKEFWRDWYAKYKKYKEGEGKCLEKAYVEFYVKEWNQIKHYKPKKEAKQQEKKE
jgi:hypothetical protein